MSRPKAITPAEASRVNRVGDERAIMNAIHSVNEALKRYRPGSRIAIALDIVGRGKVGDEVQEHFRKAGWRVVFQSDQRDGDFYWFGG